MESNEKKQPTIWERAEGFSTTFMLDFKVANAFGESAIKDTFKRAFAEWKNDVLYLTSLCEVLNYWCWEYYEKNNSRLSELYTELYEKASDYGYSTFTGEDARYFFQKLD